MLSCCRHSYKSSETPNVQYINTHQVLQNLRQQAKDNKGQGPRVLVAGPTDTGKSSLCTMLLNWAVRSDYQPTYVDLDIGKDTPRTGCCLQPHHDNGCDRAMYVFSALLLLEGWKQSKH